MKSQISIYFLIGLLFFLVLGSILYYTLKTSTSLSQYFNPSKEDLSKSMEDCVRTLVFEAIDEYGLCDTENKIKEKIMDNLYFCLDLSRYEQKGYKLNADTRPRKVEVTITKDNILVILLYPIEIYKNDEKYFFTSSELKIERTSIINISLINNIAIKDYFLVSPNKKVEIYIPKGTKLQSNQNINKISVYIEELCPDDPSVIGRVKYSFFPDIKFDPYAFVTIRYEDSQLGIKAKEEKIKLAYIFNKEWFPIESSANVQSNYVKTNVKHLSDWSATCNGINKLGQEVMFHDLILDDSDLSQQVIAKDLACAYNFSGPCGYVKLIVYLRPETSSTEMSSNDINLYKSIIDNIYDKQLIPIITLKEKREESFFPHPGDCQTPLNCKYGEDEDGSNKPIYDYSRSADIAKRLIDEIHNDKPEWPLYIEIGEEPNLAYEWNDISITDYEIKQYTKYFTEIASAIKSLPHSNSIKIMTAGLAPTKGLKKCELTPKYAKEYDWQPDTTELSGSNKYSFKKGDCKLLGYEYDYIVEENYCYPNRLLSLAYSEPSCASKEICCDEAIEPDCEPQTDCYESAEEKANDCICPAKKEYIDEIGKWYDFYVSKNYQHVFIDLAQNVESAKLWECDESNYKSNEHIETMNNVKQRILDTFDKYCFEKKIEINTNEYLSKLFSDTDYGQQACILLDVYADHSYPSVNNLDTYPGGESPFGMEAYKERFNLVKTLCGNKLEITCTNENIKDTDNDGIIDIKDNCANEPNPDQEDWDKDGIGDICDDSDNDGVKDNLDKCPNNSEIIEGEDSDSDGIADACDNCPELSNRDQTDLDLDKIGDACDDDTDFDGVVDIGFVNFCKDDTSNCRDNCRYKKNGPRQGTCENNFTKNCVLDQDCENSICQARQQDKDDDGFGDVCDNCPDISNPDQKDWNRNWVGDKCEDSDNDGFLDDVDFCRLIPSPDNKGEYCNAEKLCVGKIMITETAWAPHPRIIQQSASFSVDDFKAQMKSAYDTWENDDNIISIIPFHIGESNNVIPEKIRDYSWTKEICNKNCVGKEIFNEIAGILNPIVSCQDNPIIVEGPCTNSKILVQNLGAEIGSDKVYYKCYKCEENTFRDPPTTPDVSYNVNGINYVYYGINQCFERDLSLPNYCPDDDGTVREAVICDEVEIDNVRYYALIRCEPSISSNNAKVHICGTVEQCSYNKDNCCEEGGDYGNYLHACKKLDSES